MKKLICLLLIVSTVSASALPKGCTVWGQVTCDGKGMAGVWVSDGNEIVRTDSKGNYYLKSDKREGSVFVSIPSNTEVETTCGMPAFWQRLTAGVKEPERHDFRLKSVDNQNFTIIAITDLHLANIFDDQEQFETAFMSRFNEEAQKAAARGPVYCLNCGDSSYDRYWYEYLYTIADFPGTLKKVGFPVPMFSVMGNHDNDGATEREGDVDFNAAEAYRKAMGPTRYSVNLGKAHLIVLDNIVYRNSEGRVDSYDGITGKRDYDSYFREDELEWLKKDLATVKDKTAPLLLAYHSPLFQYKSGLNSQKIISRMKKNGADADSLLREFSALLREFTDVHCITGHTHKNLLCYGRDDTSNFPDIANITEHNFASASGCWWQTAAHGGLTLAPDGGPGGFEVFPFSGSEMEWYFVSVDDGAGKQFRVFDLNSVREYWRTNGEVRAMSAKLPARGHYADIEDNLILVNVWAWETGWKISVSEDGVELPVQMKKAENPQLTISYRLPKMGWDDNTLKERWPEKQASPQVNAHYFLTRASSPCSTVTVKVTDNFGHEYIETVTRPKAFGKRMR